MPAPLLIPIAIGSGWLAGKGAQAYGDHVIGAARDKIEATRQVLEKKEAEFTSKRKVYLARLISYSKMVSAMIGEGPVTFGENSEHLAPDLKQIWLQIAPAAGFLNPWKSNKQLWEFSSNEARTIQGALATKNPVLAAGAGLQLFTKGAKYALDAKKYLSDISYALKKVEEDAELQVTTLANQYENLSLAWDRTVVPNIEKAIGPPRDENLVSQLREFAYYSERTARKFLEEYGDAN